MQLVNKTDSIIGWGVDADEGVRPNYPMWKPATEGTGAHWKIPEQQPNFVDFHSIERPRTTHVFGNTCHPKGLSGIIRKFAFKYSESNLIHWMTLLFADRVDMVEGLIEDVSHGILPRPLKEMGWEVDKRFKTKRFYIFRGIGIGLLVVGAGLAYQMINNISRR